MYDSDTDPAPLRKGRSFFAGREAGHRTRVACLRRAEAAARCGSNRNRKFIFQNSIFKIKYACPASAASNPPEASPQPSGRACDVEEQPSARGRLRAAGHCATEFTSRHFHYNKRLRAADCFAIEFVAKHPGDDRRLRAANVSDVKSGSKWSEYNRDIGPQPAKTRSMRTCGTRAAGLRRRRLRPADA